MTDTTGRIAAALADYRWVINPDHPNLTEASRHRNHRYNSDCAICLRDLDRIAAVALDIADRAALERAAEAYSRSGTQVSPDLFDEIVDEAAQTMKAAHIRWNQAWRTDSPENRGYPLTAQLEALGITAALAAALDLPPTQTAPEITDELRRTRTYDDDALRLHLAAKHGDLVILGASDQEAAAAHDRAHSDGYDAHPSEDMSWTVREIDHHIGANAHRWDPDQFNRALTAHLDRIDTPAGMTPAGDRLRLHLASAHLYFDALGCTDDQAASLHNEYHISHGSLWPHEHASLYWGEGDIEARLQTHELNPEIFDEQEVETLKRRLRAHLLRVAAGTRRAGDGFTTTAPGADHA